MRLKNGLRIGPRINDRQVVHTIPWVLRAGQARCGHVFARALSVERGLQLGEMPIAFDAPQARFDLHEGARHPAMLLLRGAPAIHLVRQLPELGVQGFQTLGGLEAAAQGAEDAKPMQRQGLFRAS